MAMNIRYQTILDNPLETKFAAPALRTGPSLDNKGFAGLEALTSPVALLAGSQVNLSAPVVLSSSDTGLSINLATSGPVSSSQALVADPLLAASESPVNSPIEANGVFSNYQPYLAITHFIALNGIYPSRDALPVPNTGPEEATGYLASIRMFAGNFVPGNSALAAGQLLTINQNQALFSLMGTTFGGNGTTNFALPNLQGRISVDDGQGPGLSNWVIGETGGSPTYTLGQSNLAATSGGSFQSFDNVQPTLATTFFIQVQGVYPSSWGMEEGQMEYLATIGQFAGNFTPRGSLPCDGRLIPISQNTALFSLIGTTYGGDGISTFALPDLRGRTIIGADEYSTPLGSYFGTESQSLGQSNMPTNMAGNGSSFNNVQPSLAMHFLIAVYGIFPSTGGTPDPEESYIGEIIVTASNRIPIDYMRCEGQLLPISEYDTLFHVIGTTYGGDGETTFALPDFRGRTPLGTGTDTFGNTHYVGETGGTETNTLTLNDIPALSITDNANINSLYGGNLNDTISGLGGNDFLVGNGGNDLIDGGTGVDTLVGGLGDDSYTVDSASDVIVENASQGIDLVFSSVGYTLGAHVENLTLTGGADRRATGNGLNNALTGNTGDNLIDGDAGADTMTGGKGNDTYMVDDAGDTIVELSSQGTDQVRSSISFSLSGMHIENLNLTGSANINATGNSYDNVINGNSGNNLINGLAGDDTMTGGLGDDTYVVGDAGDVIVESSSQGNDLIQSSISFDLTGLSIETLTLTGSANINATGNNANNVLNGNSGDNVLDGMGSVDTMAGAGGNDTYYIDNPLDVVIEASNQGTDTVFSTRSYSLAGTFVEILTLTSSGNASATGNSLANTLNGNTGNNLIDGAVGADTMTGGLGDDTYVVDNAGDVIVETSSQGNDLVLSSVSYAVTGLSIETLTLTGSADINATGSSVNNVLNGNSGDNVLDGMGGVDTMAGAGGNDTYYIDNPADVVIETSNHGTDTVFSTRSYSLAGTFVEILTLTGGGNASATGNSLANTLTGNSGDNTLSGLGGSDILTGGLGADIFLFQSGSGADTIADFNKAQSDRIDISAYTSGVANAGLVTQSGGDVIITLGGSNVITVQGASTADVLTQIIW